MTEYVFRRFRNGVRSRLYCGRYTLVRGESPRTVALNTPDKLVARKRLRDIIVEMQREAEGIISPRSQREAAAAGLETLVNDFAADLAARGRSPAHQNDTLKRVRRIIAETGWRRLADIRADQFVKWRATLSVSAKTAKEYQAAINNFLNWLVRLDRVALNPLAKVPQVATRGKQVRLARAFTVAELTALFAIAPDARRLVYQTLAYTGQRRAEVKALRWGDLHLDGDQPRALFRAETMKDDKKRALPLHPSLAAALRLARPANVAPGKLVFARFPKWKTLLADLERVKVARTDETGRVVHFHSFRKTFQTLGVNAGVNQRAAQEMLGHTDANLTAKVYTDVPALQLHSEIAKIPWVSGLSDGAVIRSQTGEKPAFSKRVEDLFAGMLVLVQEMKDQGFKPDSSFFKNGAANGIRTRDP